MQRRPKVPAKKNIFEVVSEKEIIENTLEKPEWLIKDFWMDHSHGIVAGEPKTFKSYLAMDMAVSIASGRDFLDKYPVKKGKVLIVQEENDDHTLKKRLVGIKQNKGLIKTSVTLTGKDVFTVDWGKKIPLYFINRQNFQLDRIDMLTELCEVIKKLKPTLLILDPFYMMFTGNINEQISVAPILRNLSEISKTYEISVMLIHHNHKNSYGKNSSTRAGQKIYGSFALHGWAACGLYLNRPSDAKNDIVVTREFRNSTQKSPVILNFDIMEDEEQMEYSLTEKKGCYMGRGK